MELICLFLAPLKAEDSAARERSEDVFETLVVPAALQLGYKPENCICSYSGSITKSIFEWIQNARAVVADLTTGNGSVCYELGFAHARAVSTVLLIQQGHTAPYDLRDMNQIRYDYTDRRSLRASIPNLIIQLRALPPRSRDNPILNALRVAQPKPTAPPRLALRKFHCGPYRIRLVDAPSPSQVSTLNALEVSPLWWRKK